MNSPVMIRLKTPRRWSRALIICLTIFLNLSLVSGPAWAGVGANPPAGNPDDYAGGDWLGTAAVDNYTNDGTVSGNVLLDAGNDVFTNNGRVTGTVNGQNWHDRLINNAGGQIDGTMQGGNGNDTIINYGTVGVNLWGGDHNDTIENHGTVNQIFGGPGEDNITNTGTVTTNINGEEDNDTITNNGIVNNYILGGDGDDTINNNNTVNNNIYGEAGNDTITINGNVIGHVTGGADDDDIIINGYVSGNVYGGDGMDYIVVSGRVDGNIQGNDGADTVKLATGASVGGVINGGAGSNAIIFDGVTDVSAFNITGFSNVTYNGSNGLSGTYSTPVADLHVSGALRLQNGTINAQSLGVWPAGSVLTGNGDINCPLSVHLQGSVAPGNSIGTISAESLEILWNSNYNVEVSGSASDQLIIANNVTLTDANLNVSVLSAPLANHKFTIIRKDSAGPVLGTLFSGLPEGATFVAGGYKFSISYVGGDGNDVVLTSFSSDAQPTPDPEPEPGVDPPAAPQVSQGDSPSPTGSLNGPTLNWPHVAGSNFYRVYRAACPTCPKEQVGRVSGTSFTDTGAQPGQVYYYWLRTENGGGLSDYSDWMAAWRYEQNPGRAGDFNGDGIMDLLWWDPDTGELSIWYMNGGGVESVGSPGQGMDIGQWLLVNTGDFNSDGICDLLWWNPTTGAAQVWYLAATASASGGMGIQATNQAGDITGNVALSYPGDLNGDGRTDLVWRDYASGQVTVWLMGADGAPELNGPPTLAGGMAEGGKPDVTGSLDWTLRGLFDMNADGKADLVWQHASDGRVVVWHMDGSQATGFSQYQRGAPGNWRIVGLGDLNGDGRGDIVWRNDTSGAVQAWILSGGAYEQRDIAVADAASWQVKAVGDFCMPGCDDVYCKNSDSGSARIVTLDGQAFTPSAP